MIKIKTNSVTETENEGKKLAAKLAPGSVVALSGEMGVGKTAFVRGLAEGLGVKSIVSSPTYAIVHEYEGDVKLYHFDMFRLESENELFDIGWDEYANSGGICAVEWSENISSALPPKYIDVKITTIGTNSRQIEITTAT